MPPQRDEGRTRVDPSAPVQENPWLSFQDVYDTGSPGGGGLPSTKGAGWIVAVGRRIRDFLFGSSAKIWSAISKIGNEVISLTNGLKDVLLRVGVYMARVGKWFVDLYRNVLRPLIARFFDAVKLLASTLRKVFKPIVDVLWRIRREILDIYRDYVRPVLDVLDRIQAFLRLLETFNVEWARRVDRWIEDLERRITQPFQQLLAKVNEVLGWINRIVTLDGLLQRVMLLESLVRDSKHTGNLWWNTMHKPRRSDEVDGMRKPVPALEVAAHRAEVTEYLRARNGPLAPKVSEAAQDVLLMIRRG